jgi:hypothetical protein
MFLILVFVDEFLFLGRNGPFALFYMSKEAERDTSG